jgi:hypothetical protein
MRGNGAFERNHFSSPGLQQTDASGVLVPGVPTAILCPGAKSLALISGQITHQTLVKRGSKVIARDVSRKTFTERIEGPRIHVQLKRGLIGSALVPR